MMRPHSTLPQIKYSLSPFFSPATCLSGAPLMNKRERVGIFLILKVIFFLSYIAFILFFPLLFFSFYLAILILSIYVSCVCGSTVCQFLVYVYTSVWLLAGRVSYSMIFKSIGEDFYLFHVKYGLRCFLNKILPWLKLYMCHAYVGVQYSSFWYMCMF